MELLGALAVVAAAGLMRGFVGVGSGMLMAPFFALLFGPVDTVTIIVIMELVVTVQLLPSVYRDIQWRVVAPMGIAAALTMPIGTHLLLTLDRDLVSRLIAAVVLAFAIVLMMGWRYRGDRPLAATIGVGAVSGVLMALTSLGNPPVMVYLLSGQDKAATHRANFTGYFAVTLLALTLQLLLRDMITPTASGRAAILLPVFMLMAWVGSRMFRESSEKRYRRVAFGVLIAAGLYGLLR